MKRGTLAWLTALLALSALAAVVTLVSRGAVSTSGKEVTSLLGAGRQGAEWQDLTMLDSDHEEYTDYTLEPDDLDEDEQQQQQQHTEELYQIGDQEFLAPSQGGVEDMALEVERALAKEQALLKKIDVRAKKHQRVDIQVVAGQIGKRGPPGPVGYPGEQGFEGERGPRGDRGFRGPTGIQGLPGIKGLKGLDGPQGPQGPQGDKGATGPAGPPGRRGREGGRGDEGPLGPNGKPGKPGKMGKMGPPGAPAQGAGAAGPPGKQGPPGPPGVAGSDGRSGPEGPRGNNGMDGSTGHKGNPGLPGRPGKSQCGLGTNLGKRLCMGEVSASAFRYASWDTVYMDVDTSKCNFKGTPKYFTSLTGNSHHWEAWTVNDIVNPKSGDAITTDPKTFRIYVRRGEGTSTHTATSYQWSIKWFGVGDSLNPPNEYYGMCCGSQKAGWRSYGSGLVIDIDTSGCGWKETAGGQTGGLAAPPPWYFSELQDTSCRNDVYTSQSNRCASTVRGDNSIYSPKMQRFTQYMKSEPGKQNLDLSRAINNGWTVNWCAFKRSHPSPRAGFPCTAPRLLAGASSSNPQGIVSNNAEICCGLTSKEWVNGGANFLKKTISLAECGFTQAPTAIFTNLIGKSGTVRNAGGVGAFSTTSDANKITVHAWTGGIPGTYTYVKARDDSWRVEWCAVGR